MADTTTKTITATLGTGYPVRGEKGDKGDSGFSPTATVTQTDTGATISITDASGTTTADLSNAPQIDDAAVNTTNPWSSKNIVDRLCSETTATGNPALLNDVVAAYPLDITASWEVQQEGEGTPHVEGYGTNKFRWADEDKTETNNYGMTLEYKAATEEIHIYGTNTYTSANTVQFYTLYTDVFNNLFVAGKTLTISVTSTATNDGLYLQSNYKDADGVERSLFQIYLNAGSSKATFTVADNFASADTIFFASTPALSAIDTTIKIQVEEGSTATAWTKYAANIRPFVGRDSVKVQRWGKNLAPVSSAYTIEGSVFLDHTIPKGTYYITANKVEYGGSNYPAIVFRDADNKDIVTHGVDANTYSITLSRDAVKVCFYSNGYSYYASSGVTSTIYDFMITAAQDAGDYEAYLEPATATLALPETVYAGSVGTDGTVTKDVIYEEWTGEEKWYTSDVAEWTNHFWKYGNAGNLYDSRKTDGVIACDRFATGTYTDTYMKGTDAPISVSSDGTWSVVAPYNTKAEWIAYLKEQYAAGTPVKVVATPSAKPTLTTTPVTISALANNTITTDADALTVTARESPIKTIAKLADRISALEAAATNISEV